LEWSVSWQSQCGGAVDREANWFLASTVVTGPSRGLEILRVAGVICSAGCPKFAIASGVGGVMYYVTGTGS